jgi:phosphate-selective porin
MKKLFTVLAIALFTVTISAQQTKPATKEPAKKETCCAKKDASGKKCTADEKAKCKTEGKAKSDKTSNNTNQGVSL